MSIDPKTPINLELTLNEVEGILAGLGELPTKTGAYGLMMKIQAQTQTQVPIPEELKTEE
jgi:hypothetical protein